MTVRVDEGRLIEDEKAGELSLPWIIDSPKFKHLEPDLCKQILLLSEVGVMVVVMLMVACRRSGTSSIQWRTRSCLIMPRM